MKKLFTNKNVVQKIIIALVIAILCNFTIPTYSHADIWDDAKNAIGDILSEGIGSILLILGDSIINVMQYCFLGYPFDATSIDLSPEEIFRNEIPLLNPDYILKYDKDKNSATTQSFATAKDRTIEKINKFHDLPESYTKRIETDPTNFINFLKQGSNFDNLVKKLNAQYNAYVDISEVRK